MDGPVYILILCSSLYCAPDGGYVSKAACIEGIRAMHREKNPARSIFCRHRSHDEIVDRDGNSRYRMLLVD